MGRGRYLLGDENGGWKAGGGQRVPPAPSASSPRASAGQGHPCEVLGAMKPAGPCLLPAPRLTDVTRQGTPAVAGGQVQ